jgi:hypothetical protein
MKKNLRSITVISTMIMNKGHYVKKETLRADGRYQVEITSNVNEAKEYSQETANEIVAKIFNPFDREYAVEDTLVEGPKTKKLISGNLK